MPSKNPWGIFGGGGSGSVVGVTGTSPITVDNTDPTNPVVGETGLVESVTGIAPIAVNNADPANPIVSVSGTIQGRDGKDGVDGVNGIDGQDGLPGNRGPIGPMGNSGPPGEDGGLTLDDLVDLGTYSIPTPQKWQEVRTTLVLIGDSPYTVKSSDFTLRLRTSGGAISVQLPDPKNGYSILAFDETGDAGSNNITFKRFGSEKIRGLAADLVVSAGFGVWYLFTDGTDVYVSGVL